MNVIAVLVQHRYSFEGDLPIAQVFSKLHLAYDYIGTLDKQYRTTLLIRKVDEISA